jgi:RNA recognition motif-containing protein
MSLTQAPVNYSARIDISIDPFSGRNPSYCFVDLQTKELAERAMRELDGSDLLGRPVKIKPGVVKSASERAQQRTGTSNGTAATGSDGLNSGSPRGNRTSPFNADRWRRDDASASAPSTPSKFNSSANGSGNGSANSDSSKRLYVGGLPRLTDQEAITSNITAFFKDYTMCVLCLPLPPPLAIDGHP